MKPMFAAFALMLLPQAGMAAPAAKGVQPPDRVEAGVAVFYGLKPAKPAAEPEARKEWRATRVRIDPGYRGTELYRRKTSPGVQAASDEPPTGWRVRYVPVLVCARKLWC